MIARVLAVVAIGMAISLAIIWTSQSAPESQTTPDDVAIASSQDEKNEQKTEEDSPSTESVDQSADQSAAGEEAARKAALEQERNELRTQAEERGERVFEGTIRVLDGDGVADLDGVPIDANGSRVAEAWRKSSYVMLMFDEVQTIDNVDFPNDGPITRDADHICLGERYYNMYNDSYDRDSASQWFDYDGQRVCVSVTRLWVGDGVSNVTVPTADDPKLLYVIE